MRNPNLTPDEQRSLERLQKIRAYAKHGLFRLVWREPFAAVFLSTLIIWAPIALVELSLWRSESYPQSFINTAPSESLYGLRQACGSPLEVKSIDGATALTRCGDYWPFVKVWRVSRATVDPTVLK